MRLRDDEYSSVQTPGVVPYGCVPTAPRDGQRHKRYVLRALERWARTGELYCLGLGQDGQKIWGPPGWSAIDTFSGPMAGGNSVHQRITELRRLHWPIECRIYVWTDAEGCAHRAYLYRLMIEELPAEVAA